MPAVIVGGVGGLLAGTRVFVEGHSATANHSKPIADQTPPAHPPRRQIERIAPTPDPTETPAMSSETDTREWSTITCECGATTTIDPAATYHVIPATRVRGNPATSEVWAEETWRWICDPCWAQLPDDTEGDQP